MKETSISFENILLRDGNIYQVNDVRGGKCGEESESLHGAHPLPASNRGQDLHWVLMPHVHCHSDEEPASEGQSHNDYGAVYKNTSLYINRHKYFHSYITYIHALN